MAAAKSLNTLTTWSLSRAAAGPFHFWQGENKLTFEKRVAGLVVLNVLSMAVTWYNQPPIIDLFGEAVEWFFTVAFTLEMGLKLMGLGWRQ